MNTPAIDKKHQPSVYGVGYLGDGDFRAYINNQQTKEYRHWISMMTRCYSEKFHIRNLTYKGCEVCEDWHNFQNFARWLVAQTYHDHNYHLDKDILKRGNKIYSPEYCCLVPIEINSMLTDSKAARGDYPVGVNFHKHTGKFQSRINISKKSIYLGVFDNPSDAHNAYLIAKIKHIQSKAQEWKDRIDSGVYQALLAWEIK